MSEEAIEKEIQDKGLNAPRLTPQSIDDAIKGEEFHVFDGSCLTVCCLTLKNGFTVTGESACASPANFNAEVGQKIAKENARSKIWALEGYLLKQKLFDGDSNKPHPKMTAKIVVSSIEDHNEDSQTLNFRAVCKEDGYSEDGLDENNTFSTFTPSLDLSVLVNNPALVGQFEEGQKYYVDFTEAS